MQLSHKYIAGVGLYLEHIISLSIFVGNILVVGVFVRLEIECFAAR